jgi:tribbles-like protein
LKLESLEDACILDDEDDSLADKHGCPAYVSPEILTTTERYSGKAADMWSLGVILYTMLIGRYPFQDSDAGALFTKIRRGMYNITDTISSRAKCLIRSLLRMNPLDRLTAEDVIHHPWFCLACRPTTIIRTDLSKDKDQLVPSFDNQDADFEFS